MLGDGEVESLEREVEEEGVVGRVDGGEVGDELGGWFSDVREFGERFCISEGVIGLVGCGERGEFVGMWLGVEIGGV